MEDDLRYFYGFFLKPSWFPSVSYDTEQKEAEENIQCPTLKDLCLEVIVCDELTGLQYVLSGNHPIPERVRRDMITAATKHCQSSSLMHMLSFWGHRSYKLELPVFCRGWQFFHLAVYGDTLHSVLNEQLDFVVELFRLALEKLYSNPEPETSIRKLDFSELPVPIDPILPVFDEIGSKLTPYICASRDISHKSRSQERTDCCCVACDKLIIVLNCAVINTDEIKNLIKILKATKDRLSPVRLVLSGFHVLQGLDESLYSGLLQLLDAESLELFSADFVMAPKIYRFLMTCPNLKGLDLSFGLRNFLTHSSLITETLEALSSLEQLTIFRCRISGELQSLLHKVTSTNLDYLCVCDCHLTESDFLFLGDWYVAKGLKNLDISMNKLDLHCIEILAAACTSLRVFEMRYCELRGYQEDVGVVFDVLSSMKRLRFLNIESFKNLNLEDVFHKIRRISQMTDLRRLRVSYSKNDEDRIFGRRERIRILSECQSQMDKALEMAALGPRESIQLSLMF